MTDQQDTNREPEEGTPTPPIPPAGEPQAAPQEVEADPRLEAIRAMGADEGTSAAGAGDPASLREPSMDFPSTDLPPDVPQAHPAEFPQLGPGVQNKAARNIALLMDVQLPVSIELGRTSLPISDILEWGQGSIIELDKLAGEPVDLMVNNKLVARGEVVVVDEKFGLRITSLISRADRLAAL